MQSFRNVVRDPLAIAFCLALLACLAGNWLIARSVPVNADLLQTYNQMQDFRQGNILLRGWMLSADNFYFTDLPFMVTLSLVLGRGLQLVYIVPFLIYGLLLLAALLLVIRTAETRGQRYFGLFAILYLIGMPFGPLNEEFFQSDIHIGTIVLSLYAVLLINAPLSGRTFNFWRLLPFSALIFAVTASDPMADVFLAAPILGLMLLRIWMRQEFSPAECAIFVSTVLATCLGIVFPYAVKALGGFLIAPTFSMSAVASHDIKRNAVAVLGALQLLFTARPSLLAGMMAPELTGITRAMMGLAVAGLALWSLVRLPGQSRRGTAQLFALGALLLGLADMLSKTFAITVQDGPLFPGPAVRYVTPVFIFLALSGVIVLQHLLPFTLRFRRQAAGMAALLALPFFLIAAQSAWTVRQQAPGVMAAPQMEVTQWLVAHRLTYGTGDYWTSQAVGPLSEGRLKLVPVVAEGGKLVVMKWNSDQSLWRRMTPPQFVAFTDGNLFGVTLQAVNATFGPPVAVYHVGGFVVAQMTAP
jgi:hypothetical protein